MCDAANTPPVTHDEMLMTIRAGDLRVGDLLLGQLPPLLLVTAVRRLDVWRNEGDDLVHIQTEIVPPQPANVGSDEGLERVYNIGRFEHEFVQIFRGPTGQQA